MAGFSLSLQMLLETYEITLLIFFLKIKRLMNTLLQYLILLRSFLPLMGLFCYFAKMTSEF